MNASTERTRKSWAIVMGLLVTIGAVINFVQHRCSLALDREIQSLREEVATAQRAKAGNVRRLSMAQQANAARDEQVRDLARLRMEKGGLLQQTRDFENAQQENQQLIREFGRLRGFHPPEPGQARLDLNAGLGPVRLDYGLPQGN